MAMKINPKLPTGDRNGLAVIDKDLVDKPHRRHVLIAIVDTDQIATDTDTDEQTPRLRLLRVEIIKDSRWPEIENLLRQAWAERQAQPTLPFGSEADRWHDLFENMDGEREDTKDWEMKHSPLIQDADVVEDVMNGPIHEGPEPVVESESTEVAVVDDDEPDEDIGSPFRPPFSS